MNDKDNTFVFKPEEPESVVEKEKIVRTQKDDYTKARISQKEEYSEEKSALPIIASILGALLVIILAALPFLLSGGEEEPPQKAPQQQQTVIPGDDDSEEEEEKEEEIVIKECLLGYNSGKIYEMENDGGYSIVFDLFDENGKKTGTDKVYITEETVIKDKNMKIKDEAFITFIENQGGDILLMDCKIREKDSVALSIKYSSEEYAEEEPEEEIPDENAPTEEAPEEEKPEEKPEENPPAENITPEANEGIVIE